MLGLEHDVNLMCRFFVCGGKIRSRYDAFISLQRRVIGFTCSKRLYKSTECRNCHYKSLCLKAFLHHLHIIIIIIIMSPHTLNMALQLSLLSLFVCMAVTDNVLETVTDQGADCVLECTAKYKPGVQYRAVRWYKVGQPPSSRLSGLLTKDLPNGTTQWYAGVEREVDLLGESRDILLPNVTCGDSGLYICHLAAPVGEQNREGRVLLTLTDCLDSDTENLMTDTYLVIFATVVLILGLVIFLISYGSLKNILRDKNTTTKKETLLDATLRPLEKKDLQLIYTLGPKTSTMKHVCV